MPPKTAAGKERALANLVQNRAVRIVSGAFGMVPADAIEAKRREVEALLTGEAGGWLRPSDTIAVTLLARVLTRLESIDRTEAIDRWLRRQASSSRPAMTVPAFVKIYLQFINYTLAILRTILDDAVEEGVLAANPARRVKPLPKPLRAEARLPCVTPYSSRRCSQWPRNHSRPCIASALTLV